jgi:hypothetical protein
MAEPNEVNKRFSNLEEATAWLKDRVWYGTGNLHDRVHKLEDRSTDRSFELEKIKEDVKNIKVVVGLDGYGGRNLISDLRDALERINDMTDTIQNLKGNVISVKDFQTFLSRVDTILNRVEKLEDRGKVQLNFWNFVQFAVIGAIIQIVASFVGKAFGAP